MRCCYFFRFVQIACAQLAPPATGNQPKIDIDPPPGSPQVEPPLPQDTELFKSPAKRKNRDSDGRQTFQLQSLSSYIGIVASCKNVREPNLKWSGFQSKNLPNFIFPQNLAKFHFPPKPCWISFFSKTPSPKAGFPKPVHGRGICTKCSKIPLKSRNMHFSH